ncbi:hypothetical protein [Neptunomonas antarctica]|uniref:Uncharacterized protein n=1 Tax=Neptunomonas antarctica TaxID=619304 RepID=A0A1N7PAX2_9GAMM|nr:hypothetical protein [Neptunomonas antarctica]SIT07772.1 hypothetical protein SAMN05421760_113105 [Neptunomonas antarctica]
MSNDDPFGKLVTIVNDQLESGKSHDEIVGMLMQSGLDMSKANHVINTIENSRNSFWTRMAIFFSSLVLSVPILFYFSFYYFGAEELTGYAKSIFLSFIAFSILFTVFASFSGKVVGIFRFFITSLWFFSSLFLACVMFIYPEWSSSFIHTGGGWRAQILGVATNLLYTLGPKGVAYILLGISSVILMLTWAEYYKLKISEYGKI